MSYQCSVCGGELKCAHDPGDDFAEYWCDNRTECEHPRCMTVTCDEDTKPRPCDFCGLNHCSRHLRKIADVTICVNCYQEAMENDAR